MMNEANELAHLLNTICSATVEAILDDDEARRHALALRLDQLEAEMRPESPTVANFFALLAAWLRGQPPSDEAISSLASPFDRVVRQMMRDAHEQGPPPPPSLISHQTLAQLVAAVIAAAKNDDPVPARQLAAHLINIETQLPPEARAEALPFFENLRALLGGADPQTLPLPPSEPYASVWQSVQYLMLVGDELDNVAREALFERLIHNTSFVLQSGDERLATQLAQALLELQRAALRQDAHDIATLVAAIRARLQGLDPTPYVKALSEETRHVWQRIEQESRE